LYNEKTIARINDYEVEVEIMTLHFGMKIIEFDSMPARSDKFIAQMV